MPPGPHPRRARLLALAAAQSRNTTSSGPAELEISGIRAHRVREPVSGRRYTLVRIETKSRMYGWGECGSLDEAALNQVRKAVIGRQATAVEPIRRELAGLPAAQAAVNMALLDITGKQAKAPVYQVLGGPTRNKARVLARLEGGTDAELRASLQRAASAGFRAFAAPLPPVTAMNQGQAFVNTVRRRLDSLREAGGDSADFVLDGAESLTPGDAASVTAALERFHLLWFDEPCKLANLGAVRKLASESVTPLGFGRNVHHGGEIQDLLREEVADVIRPGIALNGITQIRRMAALAETYYIAVAPHHDGGPVASAAALHLAASLPNFFIQQVPLPAADEDRRMRGELTTRSVEVVKDGFAALPAGFGLGIDVDTRALEKYAERAG